MHTQRGPTRATNRKLSKTKEALERRFGGHVRIASFSLPQLRSAEGRTVCPFAGACAEVCYASQGSYYMPHVQAAYEHNYQAVRAAGVSLAALLLEDLAELGTVTHVRLHDSGDFFSRHYVQRWMTVAARRPELTFYGYTKSLPLIDFDALPPNVRLTQSMGGKRDDLIDCSRSHSRIFPTGLERRAAGYANGNLDDLPVIIGETRIGLVYHGTRVMTPEQAHALKAP